MEKDTEERKRSHLRLVVNNVEKRVRPAAIDAGIVSFEELVARRDEMSQPFYDGLPEQQAKIYAAVEDFLQKKGWPYALDPDHGKMLIVPASCIAPGLVDCGGSALDEALIVASADGTDGGSCLTIETILPFYSDDDGVMEDALLYGPILPYGALFLEENQQDGLLDLIYRIAFPFFPPDPSAAYIERFVAVAASELREIMKESNVEG